MTELLVAREGLEHDVLNHTFNQCYTTTESEQTLPVIAEFINVFSFVLMVHTAHNGGEARIAKRYFCKAALVARLAVAKKACFTSNFFSSGGGSVRRVQGRC